MLPLTILFRPVGPKELELIAAAAFRRFPVQNVGARRHQELWVPADELEEFNRHIVGQISVVAEFRA